MTIAVTRLTPCFAARVDGADITRPLDDLTWSAIRAAFEEHSVLLFRGQALTDDEQIAFSARFDFVAGMSHTQLPTIRCGVLKSESPRSAARSRASCAP